MIHLYSHQKIQEYPQKNTSPPTIQLQAIRKFRNLFLHLSLETIKTRIYVHHTDKRFGHTKHGNIGSELADHTEIFTLPAPH
jgi:hypothetical protein